MTRAGVLLAAGASRRFGSENKLIAPLNDRPLVSYAAEALRASDLDALIGVVQSDAVAELLTGFDIARPSESDPEQSDSLRAGIFRAQQLGVTKVTIVLGDMPFVTSDAINAVTRLSTDTRPAATTDGARPIPPVCFPETYFSKLAELRGDRGAGALLFDAVLLDVPEAALQDVDTRDALKMAEKSFG